MGILNYKTLESREPSEDAVVAMIKACDLDLSTLEWLKRRTAHDERSGDDAAILHVPSRPADPSRASNPSVVTGENPTDELVIQLDAKSFRVFLNAMEAWLVANRTEFTDAENDPRERARRIRESLSARPHSDSDAIQHEDRQR